MKCQIARHWILMYPSAESMPGPLRRHLHTCARCRRRRRRLLGLEKELKAETANAGSVSLQVFLGRLAELPAQTLPPSRTPARRFPRSVLCWAAAILVFVGLAGWLLHAPNPADQPTPRPVVVIGPGAEDQLVVRFVQRDLVLAGTTAPAEQWQVFSDMADDLRVEAIRLSDAKAPDDVPMVSALYERVLQRGLVGRVDLLPEKERSELLQALAHRLRNHEKEFDDKLRRSSADWVTLLQPIQQASRQTAETLAADVVPARGPAAGRAAIPGGSDYRRLLLSALVMNGLRLAEETDPLKRADCCSDLADHLLQAIVTASVKGDKHNVSELGKHLGEFVERGVSTNLARVPNDDPRVKELRQVMLRTSQILLALDKTVEEMAARGDGSKADSTPDQLKNLEKMLKDVEKSLKKVQKSFKETDKGKAKDKEDKKAKGKGKDWSRVSPASPTIREYACFRSTTETLDWRRVATLA